MNSLYSCSVISFISFNAFSHLNISNTFDFSAEMKSFSRIIEVYLSQLKLLLVLISGHSVLNSSIVCSFVGCLFIFFILGLLKTSISASTGKLSDYPFFSILSILVILFVDIHKSRAEFTHLSLIIWVLVIKVLFLILHFNFHIFFNLSILYFPLVFISPNMIMLILGWFLLMRLIILFISWVFSSFHSNFL